MSRIELLNDGGYWGLEKVQFPVIVNGSEEVDGYGILLHYVSVEELVRVGADGYYFAGVDRYAFEPESVNSRLVTESEDTTNA